MPSPNAFPAASAAASTAFGFLFPAPKNEPLSNSCRKRAGLAQLSGLRTSVLLRDFLDMPRGVLPLGALAADLLRALIHHRRQLRRVRALLAHDAAAAAAVRFPRLEAELLFAALAELVFRVALRLPLVKPRRPRRLLDVAHPAPSNASTRQSRERQRPAEPERRRAHHWSRCSSCEEQSRSLWPCVSPLPLPSPSSPYSSTTWNPK